MRHRLRARRQSPGAPPRRGREDGKHFRRRGCNRRSLASRPHRAASAEPSFYVLLEVRPRPDLDRLPPALENPRRLQAEEFVGAILDQQHRSLAKADDGSSVLFMKLVEANLARLALVRGARIGIEIMTVQLKRNQPEGVERSSFDDGHVVCCANSRRGNYASGARSDVRQTGAHSLTNRVEQIAIVELFQQAKRVPAANE